MSADPFWCQPKSARAGLVAICLAAFAVAPALAADVHPEIWPAAPSGKLIKPDVEAEVTDLLAKLSLEEKIGQMIQADIDSIKPDDLRTYKLGSILAGGNAAPGHDIHTSPDAWLALTDAFYRASLQATPGHKPIPIIFGIDAVHGNGKIRGATLFPHNVALGAAHDPGMMERIGHATAQEVAAIGVDWTFAPTIAVVRDPRWGRSYESYSEDPREVAQYAAAMVAGVQGRFGTPDFMSPGHTLVSAKHFLGDGGTRDGRDQGNNLFPEPELARIHGAGYPPAIDAGAMIVMASYNSWQGTKMHANRGLMTDVLKGRFGFDGFIVGDWNAQEEIPGCTKFDCAATINAGLDMFMAPDGWREIYRNTIAEVRAGIIPLPRIDDAVRRILRVKILAGVLARPAPKDRPDAGHFEVLGSPEHRALAREAVRKSLVLLKNNGNVLPLDPHAHILVAGTAADDIKMQSGGWTIDWQGDKNVNAELPGAMSIYAGIKAAVEHGGGTAILSADGSFTDKPDAAIVVFGESPYAEFMGDRETLLFSPDDRSALTMLKALKAKGVPTISVFLSGRALWVNPELNASDAFVAAWLPGSEGEGIADVLFRHPAGETAYDFTGRLSFSWPATAMPVTFDADDKPSGALFPRGYGLNDAAKETVAALVEDPKVPAGRNGSDTLFQAGHVTAPWSIYVDDDLAEVRLTTESQPSPNGAVSVKLFEDGVQASWSGGKAGTFRIGSKANDLSARAAAGQELVLRYRVDQPPAGKVALGMTCDAKCQGGLDATASFKAGPVGGWTELRVPLSCFAAAGAKLSKIDSPLVVTSSGRFGLSIAGAVFAPPAGHAASCPAPLAMHETKR